MVQPKDVESVKTMTVIMKKWNMRAKDRIAITFLMYS